MSTSICFGVSRLVCKVSFFRSASSFNLLFGSSSFAIVDFRFDRSCELFVWVPISYFCGIAGSPVGCWHWLNTSRRFDPSPSINLTERIPFDDLAFDLSSTHFEEGSFIIDLLVVAGSTLTLIFSCVCLYSLVVLRMLPLLLFDFLSLSSYRINGISCFSNVGLCAFRL